MDREKTRRLLRDRLALAEEQIVAACRKAARPRESVLLVAVTKTVAAEVAVLLPELGVADLGESRPQELWRKAETIAGVRWHQIGHLQTNKVERTLPLAHLVHSGDRVGLLQALDREAARQGRSCDVLLQVNASAEASKHGFALDDVERALPALKELRHVRVRGLMTMAAYDEDPERCRPTFARLCELRDRLASRVPPPHALEHLSMGMSNDFAVAIEEGATIIRLGTVLFEGISPEQA